MERTPGALTEEAVTRLDAADEAVDEGTAPAGYDGCRFCEVDVVLELVAEKLRAAGHTAAADWLTS